MRVKRGVTSHKRHNKIRKATKGMTRSNGVVSDEVNKQSPNPCRMLIGIGEIVKEHFENFGIQGLTQQHGLNGTTYSRLIAALKASQHYLRP